MSDLMQQIEAILFAAARVVSKEELKTFCVAADAEIDAAIKELEQKLNESNSAVMLVPEADGWKLAVREKYTKPLHHIVPNTELNRSILETLAVIAWKQPVMQAEVINVRSTAAYEHIGELERLGFITRAKQGRSFILKTSQKFAEYFDLPKKEAIKELFKDIKAPEGGQTKIDDTPNVEVYQSKVAGDAERVGEFEIYDAPEKKSEEANENAGTSAKEEFYETAEEASPKEEVEDASAAESQAEPNLYVDLNDDSSAEETAEENSPLEKEEEETAKAEAKAEKKSDERMLEPELEEIFEEKEKKAAVEKEEEEEEE